MEAGQRLIEHGYTTFNRVELLVHPFFAVENARVNRSAESALEINEKRVLEAYDFVGLIDSWRRKVFNVQKNPESILVLVGLREMEAQTRKAFFSGKLTPQKLGQFTREYQSFLREAKRVLGKRLFYVSGSIYHNNVHILISFQQEE